MADSLRPDLDGTSCAVGGCFDVADGMGAATVTLPALVGVPDGEDRLVLEVPLCAHHAHLLRMGVDDCDLDSGI